MNTNLIFNRIMILFGGMMSLFYIALGSLLIFAGYFAYIDKVLRVIVGSPLILYGVYRVYRTIVQVIEEFKSEE